MVNKLFWTFKVSSDRKFEDQFRIIIILLCDKSIALDQLLPKNLLHRHLMMQRLKILVKEHVPCFDLTCLVSHWIVLACISSPVTSFERRRLKPLPFGQTAYQVVHVFQYTRCGGHFWIGSRPVLISQTCHLSCFLSRRNRGSNLSRKLLLQFLPVIHEGAAVTPLLACSMVFLLLLTMIIIIILI